MPYSNLSVVLTAEQKADILKKVQELKSLMPFLVSLSAKERQAFRKLGGKRKGYVDDIRKITKANPKAIPPSIDLVEFDKDANFYSDISEVMENLLPIFEGVQDTTLAVGAEAVRTASLCHGSLKIAGKGDNLQLRQSLDNLKVYFAAQGKRKKEPGDEKGLA